MASGNPRVSSHDPRTVHLHDDFVRYIQRHTRLDTHDQPRPRRAASWVAHVGADVDRKRDARKSPSGSFGGWAELFATSSPPVLTLTGGFSWAASDDAPAVCGCVTQLSGGYDRLEFDRDEVVGVLQQLVGWCGQVRVGAGGRLSPVSWWRLKGSRTRRCTRTRPRNSFPIAHSVSVSAADVAAGPCR